VHQLRALLKELLRRHGFRALDLREEHDAAAGDITTVTENKSGAEAQHPF
jgi:hypothetical protein